MSNFLNNESNDNNNTIVQLPPPYLPKPEGLHVQTPKIVMAPLKNGGSRRKQRKSHRATTRRQQRKSHRATTRRQRSQRRN